MRLLRYFIVIFASVFCPMAVFACWDDDDDYLYDDSIWLDEIVCTPDDDWDDDDGSNDDWWRTDWEDTSGDEDDFDWDDDYDDNSINSTIGQGSTNNQESVWGASEKYHKPRPDEICLWWDKWKYLPAHFPPQLTKMGCVPTVLEYIANYYDDTLSSDVYSPYRSVFESFFFAMSDGSDINDLGVTFDQLSLLISEWGFDFEQLYDYGEIRNSIYANEAVIATIENDYGYHEVFITSFLDSGDFRGVDPGTGTFIDIKSGNLVNVYVIRK